MHIFSWEQRKLNDVAKFSKGNGYSKGDLIEAGTPIILYGRLYTKYETTISDVDTFVVAKDGSVYSKGGEVIVPASGETAEDIARAATVDKPGILLGGDLNVVMPNEEINSAFLAISISNGSSQRELAKKAQGKSVVHIHNEEIRNLVVPFPTKAEQNKIVDYFANLDSLITLHQRKQNLLKNHILRSKIMLGFDRESDFEQAIITALQSNGWDKEVIHHPTEEQLIQNWADILYDNNNDIDRLNQCPLIPEEMDELLDQVKNLRTPLALNGFMNGKTVSIIRKNPKDTLHYGKEISLKIYDRMEIAGGSSRYQIVEQPLFPRHEKVLQDRRGDLMLLINGMPVFHIELKKSGVPVTEASNQIEKYAHEGVFTGLFSLVQIFVAMNPEETLYFANPGPDGKFNPDFYFHWADFNNEPINDWRKVTSTILSIPLAHQSFAGSCFA